MCKFRMKITRIETYYRFVEVEASCAVAAEELVSEMENDGDLDKLEWQYDSGYTDSINVAGLV